MNKIILTLAAASLSLSAAAQTPYWQDINTTSVNAQTKRTELIFFPSEQDAASKPLEQSPYYLSLNGEWDFAYFDSQNNVPEQIEFKDKIKVPGNWEFQGFGVPVYVNISYEFAPKDPQPPLLPDDVPVGVYKRTFTVPSSWDGRAVYLNLCGAKSGVYVYVNGQEVGYSEDSKDLARYCINDYLKEGENELLLKMYRWSTGSYLECQDFWRISGIERDVYLSSEKSSELIDIDIVADLDEACENGVFSFSMQGSETPAFKLLDKDGSTVLEGGNHFKGSIENVRKWTAETPELYKLIVNYGGEYFRFDVGFRRIEVKGDYLYVNGKTVKLKGVNLHEHNQYTGHYTDREYIRSILLRMRELNINAIRTSHYPQPRAFYELCDSLGFYVYSEANVESHGMGYGEESLAKDPDWLSKHLDRVENMYRRTHNYPCVIILSLGNEAGDGVNFDRCYDLLKGFEKNGQHRPVVYERAEGGRNTDIYNPMYPGADWFHRHGEQLCGKPCIPCEYAHAMGNSTGSFDLQWGYIYSYDNLQGGFIWDWMDQGILEKDEKGREYYTYGGDYGANEWFPTDWNFNCNGMVAANLDPHPGAYEIKHWYQDVNIESANPASGNFTVFNRFYFKNLDGYELSWRIEEDGKEISGGSKALDGIAPQTRQEFSVQMPSFDADKTYYINFYVSPSFDSPLIKKGYTVADNQFLLKEAAPVEFAAGNGRPLKLKEEGNLLQLRSWRVKFAVDKTTGNVVQYKYRRKNMIDGEFGLRPNFWRAPNDNDWGNGYPLKCGAWKDSVVLSSVQAIDGGIQVEYNLPFSCKASVKYLIDKSGKLGVVTSFKGSKDVKPVEVPRIGFRMHLAKSCDKFEYFGRGPIENYWDRATAAFVGLYSSSASTQAYPYYVRPQETGHHTECRHLSNALFRVDGYKFFEFNCLRNTIEDFDVRGEDGGNAHQHMNDITPEDFVELCIDYKMTGVGGYDSWGSHPEWERCLWTNQDYDFSFTITPKRK